MESELERFYNIYVEKYANIDYLEYELDLYNMMDAKHKQEQNQINNHIKKTHE